MNIAWLTYTRLKIPNATHTALQLLDTYANGVLNTCVAFYPELPTDCHIFAVRMMTHDGK